MLVDRFIDIDESGLALREQVSSRYMLNRAPTVCSGTPVRSRSEDYVCGTLLTAGSPARWAASAICGRIDQASKMTTIYSSMIDATLLSLPR